MANHPEAAGNFLVPNGTFIAELIAFLLILAILYRYVVPIVQKAMRDRQEMIRKQVEESEEASRRLAEANQRYREALNEARNEAAEIRETARADAQRTAEEVRRQAQEESARIVARGEEQLARHRDAIVRELREEVGTLAVELAEKIIDQRLADDARVRTTVDSFIAGLEAQDRATDTARAGTTP
jgi:F-type H+-transporting ATPase subunit b